MRNRIAAAVMGALLAVGGAVALAGQANAETMPRIFGNDSNTMPRVHGNDTMPRALVMPHG